MTLPPSPASRPDVAELTTSIENDASERAGLDGYSIVELSEYLDRDRTPVDPVIESSSACQRALAGLERLHALSATILETPADSTALIGDEWVARVLGRISVDAVAGRDIPYAHDDLIGELYITEGAVRDIVRGAGDEFDGILLGRCELVGDVTRRGQPVRVTVDASVLWGQNIPDLVADVRLAVLGALHTHTQLNVTGVDVTIHDLTLPPH